MEKTTNGENIMEKIIIEMHKYITARPEVFDVPGVRDVYAVFIAESIGS